MTIELHTWPTPNGWKIAIALEEMGLDYEVHPVDIGAGAQFEPAFLAMSPNGKIPAIVDRDGPDGAAISIFESGAILQYLACKSGRFYGQTERDRIIVDQWLFFQVGHVGPMAGQAHHFFAYAPAMEPPVVLPYAQERYRREVGRLYAVLDRRLAEVPFVAGADYSIADMALWGWVSRHEKQQQDLGATPHLLRWFKTLAARPAVKAGRAVLADRRADFATDAKARAIMFGRA